MCGEEGASLQQGMNFRPPNRRTVILMSRRPNAPYKDEIIDDSRTIIYEGHDVPKSPGILDTKSVDQVDRSPRGLLTQNGRFLKAANEYTMGLSDAEIVQVYEKIRDSIWVFNGAFRLVDAWEDRRGRRTYKFRLELDVSADTKDPSRTPQQLADLQQTRVIPSAVKLEVWQRDRGECVLCGSHDNLHFDHDLPYSKGGSSLTAKNVRLLCARHNLRKGARIE